MNKEEILKITKKFHDTYEKLSKEYDYETRKETRVFDINSSNGKLMYATVNEVIKPILEENKELKKQLEEYQLQNINLRADIMIQKMAFPNELIKDKTFYNLYDMPTYEELLVQQKEFINFLEDNYKETQDIWYIKILQKYKEIIGVSDEKKRI